MPNHRCDVCGRIVPDGNVMRMEGRALCPKHGCQMKNYGEITDPTPYSQMDRNAVEVSGAIAYVSVVNRSLGLRRFVIDAEDAPRVRKLKWNYNGKTICCRGQSIARFVTGTHGDKSVVFVKHVNGDLFDNRKENLILVKRKLYDDAKSNGDKDL